MRGPDCCSIRADFSAHCAKPGPFSSATAAGAWSTPLAFVFIDGGHSREAAETDYRTWAPHVMPGGYLAIHDLFPDPLDGGQAPIEISRLALASGLFEALETTRTLGVLRRVG